MEKLHKQGIYSGDKYYLLTSTARYNDFFTNEDVNLVAMTIQNKTLSHKQKLGLRNYFMERVLIGINVHPILQGLKALNVSSDVPVLRVTSKRHFELKDSK